MAEITPVDFRVVEIAVVIIAALGVREEVIAIVIIVLGVREEAVIAVVAHTALEEAVVLLLEEAVAEAALQADEAVVEEALVKK